MDGVDTSGCRQTETQARVGDNPDAFTDCPGPDLEVVGHNERDASSVANGGEDMTCHSMANHTASIDTEVRTETTHAMPEAAYRQNHGGFHSARVGNIDTLRSVSWLMARAVWKGTVIAESDETVMVEGNHYFPPESVNSDYLDDSATHTRCHWKGEASYYDVVVEGQRNADAAWYYPTPSSAASEIKDHVAFWRGVRIES